MAKRAKMAVGLVITLMVLALMAAFLLPVAIGELAEDNTYTLNQTVGDTDEITTNFNATLDSSDGTTANYTLEYVPDGSTATANVTESSNDNVTLNGATIELNATTVNANDAETTFSVPPDAGFSSSAQSIWGILDLILVLAAFLFVIGVAVSAMDRL